LALAFFSRTRTVPQSAVPFDPTALYAQSTVRALFRWQVVTFLAGSYG
jgi:hypothetical protein